ncbi:MAG: helix-turn-helix transcriptional regulator [Prolixibacteraceae bacterium]|nr:helix-turn-helix transcriptional regulator [Prolixibacteraceae bacterium]
MKKNTQLLIGANSNEIVLAFLQKADSYGYEIVTEVKRLSGGKVEWNVPSIYPVLSKLEKRKLITSYWKTADFERPRRYYTILDAGKKEYARLEEERNILNYVFDKIEKAV